MIAPPIKSINDFFIFFFFIFKLFLIFGFVVVMINAISSKPAIGLIIVANDKNRPLRINDFFVLLK